MRYVAMLAGGGHTPPPTGDFKQFVNMADRAHKALTSARLTDYERPLTDGRGRDAGLDEVSLRELDELDLRTRFR
jgi:hypothetical protein